MISSRRWLGGILARYLSRPAKAPPHGPTHRIEALIATLRKGDVLLIEGTSRISSAIKYITQSTWSHAALCFRTPADLDIDGERLEVPVLVEADLNEGVRTVPLRQYLAFHTRICRPVGLLPEEIDAVCRFMLDRVGNRYDLKHVFDLARYLIRTPMVPERKRRRLLALGSRDPTKAICSSLLAEAFQSVRYPVLPDIERCPGKRLTSAQREILHIRHHSLFAPRDFDISPFFKIVKPTLESGFDFRAVRWSAQSRAQLAAIGAGGTLEAGAETPLASAAPEPDG